MMSLEIRLTQMKDSLELERWLSDPQVYQYFPMYFDSEYKEAAVRWVSFCRYKCSLTAWQEGRPCAIATLYLQPYQRLIHQSELGLIVAPEYRGRGIGGQMIDALEDLAKRDFKVELLHLQVYYGNPATRLYERKGFKEFGRQDKFMKESDGSYQGRLFMQKEISTV
jgi:RimJ/RimL family protein N-acetyltransferase